MMHRFRLLSHRCGAFRAHLILLGLLAVGFAPVLGAARKAVPPQASHKTGGAVELAVRQCLAAMPLVFEENVGQATGDVRFLARGGGFALGISGVETTLSLSAPAHSPPSAQRAQRDLRGEGPEGSGGEALEAREYEKSNSVGSHRPLPSDSLPSARRSQDPASVTEVKTRLIGANPQAKACGEKRLPARINYFIGDDPKKWRTDVPAYEQVRTAAVYPGIDVVHYGQQTGALEYDFVVAPGADPNAIRFAIEGAERVSLAQNGDLVVQTLGGELRQRKPVCFQGRDGQRTAVAGAFHLADNGSSSTLAEVSFLIGDYDPTRTLVIDPVLAYSTYLGGGSWDMGTGIAVDSSGRAYVTGYTNSTNFPSTSGKLQGDPGDGGEDVFVAVLDPTKSGAASLLYATYLGGSGGDKGNAIAVDPTGRAYVTGDTRSADFPITALHFQGEVHTDPETVRSEAFVAVLNPAMTGAASLVYSSYLGGYYGDSGSGVAVDSSGVAYVCGNTVSEDFPTTAGRYQGAPYGGGPFVAVLDPSQDGITSLLYSTYLGGNNGTTGTFIANDIALDGSGRAYVTGWAGAADFPTTASKYQSHQGEFDGFVSVLDPSLNGAASLVYSTCLGGVGTDRAFDIAVDGSGRAYVTGLTTGVFPVTAGSYQGDQGGGDAFLTVLDPAQSGAASLVYSTYLGGDGPDTGWGIALDAAGRVYLSGYTESLNFPTTADRYQDYRGESDVYTAVLDLTLSGPASLIFCTYLGGAGTELDPKVAVDATGRAYVTGLTYSTDFPTTAGRFQGDAGDGREDAFVTVLDLSPAADPSDLTATAVSSTRIDLAWSDNSGDETGFKIERKTTGAFAVIATVGANVTTYSNTGLAANTTYTYQVRGYLGAVYSAYTNEAAATTPTLPVAPSNFVATATTSTRVNLFWSDNSSDETGFKIDRKTGAGSFGPLTSVPANKTFYPDTSGLSPSTTYTYRMRSYNGNGNSAFSNEDDATTPPLPVAPTNLVATAATSTRVDLTWNDNSGNENGFKIDRKTGMGSFSTIYTTSANKTSYSDSAVAPQNTYTYRVRSYNVNGASTHSNEDDATTPALPVAPTNLVATAATSTRIDLGWSDNSSDENGFKIDRKTGAGSFGPLTSVAANKTSYSDTSAAPNTTYTYRVRSFNGNGSSGFSNEDDATTPALPRAPTALNATAVTASQIDLSWTDNATDEQGFKIERKTTGAFAPLVTRAANVTSYSNTGLAANTTYTYRLRAYNANGHSAYSNEEPETTLAAPSGRSAVAASSTRINLAWSDSSSDQSGFKMERKTGTSEFAVIATMAANVTNYANTGLIANTAYSYRVRAYRTTDYSAYSNEGSDHASVITV